MFHVTIMEIVRETEGYHFMLNTIRTKNVLISALATLGFVILPVAVLAAPNVAVQISPVSNGSNITYTIVATNTGDQPASGVIVRDTLATGESFSGSVPLPDTSTTTDNGQTVLIWNVPTIPAGGSVTFTPATLVTGSFPTSTVLADNVQVSGTNFPTQTGTTSVLVGPTTGATPTPVPTATPTPVPTTLPVTGINPFILGLIALAGFGIGISAYRLTLKNSF